MCEAEAKLLIRCNITNIYVHIYVYANLCFDEGKVFTLDVWNEEKDYGDHPGSMLMMIIAPNSRAHKGKKERER